MKKGKNLRVGLMGGTFDPIHLGHLQIASYGKEQFGLDQVWFMPTGSSYHKHKQWVSTMHRCAMVQLAISDRPDFYFCDLEVQRQGPTYTAETLTELRREYPEVEFYFMVGADSLNYMEHWYKPQVIFDDAVILVAGRNTQTREEIDQKIQQLTDCFHGDIRVINKPVLSVSSSQIREGLLKGQEVKSVLPEPVSRYITDHGLYQGQLWSE